MRWGSILKSLMQGNLQSVGLAELDHPTWSSSATVEAEFCKSRILILGDGRGCDRDHSKDLQQSA